MLYGAGSALAFLLRVDGENEKIAARSLEANHSITTWIKEVRSLLE